MYPDIWRSGRHVNRVEQRYRPVNRSPSGERDRLRGRKKRNYQDVDTQVEHGRDLMNLNVTQRYYAENWYPELYYRRSESSQYTTSGYESLSDYRISSTVARTRPASNDITHQFMGPIASSKSHSLRLSGSRKLQVPSNNMNQPDRRLGPPQQPYTESTPPMQNKMVKGGYAEDQPVIARQPYLSADVAVLLEILKSQSRPLQPSVVPSFTANLAEDRQNGERKNLTENALIENLTAGGLAPKPPTFFTGNASFRHPYNRSAAEMRPNHRPIVIEISDSEENNMDHRQRTSVGNKEAATTRIRENDRSTDSKSEIPIIQPPTTEISIQPPTSSHPTSSNKAARARNFAMSSRKQKNTKRRTRDRKRKVDERRAVQIEAETLINGTPTIRTSVADSEGIPASAKRARLMPNCKDKLTSAMPLTENAVAHDINADVDIGKDRAYEQVISRLFSAHIDANIYINEIAKDTQDQSTAEKLTKLYDQMTTAKNMALRNLRGHPDALERVIGSLRGKTR